MIYLYGKQTENDDWQLICSSEHQLDIDHEQISFEDFYVEFKETTDPLQETYLYGKKTPKSGWKLILKSNNSDKIIHTRDISHQLYYDLMEQYEPLDQSEPDATDYKRFLALAQNYEHEVWTNQKGETKIWVNFAYGQVSWRFNADGALIEASGFGRY